MRLSMFWRGLNDIKLVIIKEISWSDVVIFVSPVNCEIAAEHWIATLPIRFGRFRPN